jgi:hypothetical protein
MTGFGAIGSGFGRMFHRPSVMAAELAWRWSLGAALIMLFAAGTIELLRSITVIGGDPLTGLQARVALIAAAWIGGTAFLWILAAASGRCATLPLLFRTLPVAARFRAQAGIAFLRAALALAGGLALLLACRLAANIASTTEDSQFGWWFLAFVPSAMLIGFCWMVVRWFLGVAPVLAAAEQQDTLGAISRAVGLFRDRPGAMFLIGICFALLQMAIAAGAWMFAMGALSVLMQWSGTAALAGLAMVALAYCALADTLRLARLGAYAAMVEDAATAIGTQPVTES